MKIINQDRFKSAIFLNQKDWKPIGTLNGVALYKIGSDDNEIIVAKIAVAMGGSLDNVSECKALELSSLATHSAEDLILNQKI